MQTKLAKLKELAAANDWRGALRLAASFARLGDDKVAIMRGHEAFGNARFAVQLGRDPAVDIAAGIAALCARYEIALPVPTAVAMPATDMFADRRAAVRAADRSGLDPAMLEFRKGDAGWYWVDPATAVATAAPANVDAKAARGTAAKPAPKAPRVKRPAPPPAPIDAVAEEFPVVRVDMDANEGVDEGVDESVDMGVYDTSAAVPAPAPAEPVTAEPAPAADVVAPVAPVAPVADITDVAPVSPKAPRANQRRAAEHAAAATGAVPTPPDFSAPTHKGYRRHLAEVVALVEAGNVDGLRAYPINPASSSRRMLARYRDAAVVALVARG